MAWVSKKARRRVLAIAGVFGCLPALTLTGHVWEYLVFTKPWVIVAGMILLPVVSWRTRDLTPSTRMRQSCLWCLRICSTVFVAVTCVFVLARWDEIRDAIGDKYIEGYSVRYTPDQDEFLPDNWTMFAHVSTKHWYAGFALWLGEIVTMATMVLAAVGTWPGIAPMFERSWSSASD